jgi:hypothetical protein
MSLALIRQGLNPLGSAEAVRWLLEQKLDEMDPLEMNILVASGVPSLTHIDLKQYHQRISDWALAIRNSLPSAEAQFQRTPLNWKNDLAFFRLGVLCWYVDEVLGIRYREDQKDLTEVTYSDPDDLFLTGVMDTRRGTCANMAALHVALGWRLGWPVSLACARRHVFCRYDDGRVLHNIEATNNGKGGFHSHPDPYYQERYRVPQEAIECGSDLKALKPRQLLGLFVSFRARYWQDTGSSEAAAKDYTLATQLFPENLIFKAKTRFASWRIIRDPLCTRGDVQ